MPIVHVREEESFEMPVLSIPTSAETSPETTNLKAPAPWESIGETAKLRSPGLPADPEPLGGEVGLEGFCPVTLRDARTQIQGSEQYKSHWQGTVYRLASADAKKRFDAHPEFYAPAKGGIDVIKAVTLGQKVQGSIEHAAWYRRQLYLFQDESTQKLFTSNPAKYAGQ